MINTERVIKLTKKISDLQPKIIEAEKKLKTLKSEYKKLELALQKETASDKPQKPKTTKPKTSPVKGGLEALIKSHLSKTEDTSTGTIKQIATKAGYTGKSTSVKLSEMKKDGAIVQGSTGRGSYRLS